MVTVVKREGHSETFDEKKIYGSVYAACASAFYTELTCERVAADITKRVKTFFARKKSVHSHEIRKHVAAVLKKKDKQLAFFYEHYLPNLKKL